ncbi:MAG: hypothetical protein MUF33_09195 [Candidatus Nanopelagicales bacterium]|jgi:hypothetical protein|nr:hypothetical protein [Candidatus Nanopelagicales bacterium]
MSITDDAARLAVLEGQAQELNDEIRRLRAVIVATTEPGTVIEVGGVPRWRVAPGKRTFDESLARSVLNADTLAACTVTKVDSAKVKAVAGEVTWSLCTKQGDPFLVVAK